MASVEQRGVNKDQVYAGVIVSTIFALFGFTLDDDPVIPNRLASRILITFIYLVVIALATASVAALLSDEVASMTWVAIVLLGGVTISFVAKIIYLWGSVR